MAAPVEVPPIYKALGLAVSNMRRRSNCTQQELADGIGISRASVANIERGEQRVFFDQIAAIATFFSLNGIDDLLSYSPSDNSLRSGRVKLSGDRLKRGLKREVRELVDELLTENQ